MRGCTILPFGDRLYKCGQKHFGRLKANPMARIPAQVEMARWLLEMGKEIEEKTFFEIGTGHCPVVPIGFFLAGAGNIITVEMYKRMEIGILRKSLEWMAQNREKLWSYYDGITEKASFEERMDLIERLRESPEKLLSEANIVYLAPADAANTQLADSSVDYHISTTVFEHIPKKDIARILKEARRVLGKDGIAIHFIDLSDHFQHQDKSITRINFLQYSDEYWEKIAGNEFAYCNRLRASDYLALFKEAGFDVLRMETQVDKDALESMRDGFTVDGRFRAYGIDDLCVTQLKVAIKARGMVAET